MSNRIKTSEVYNRQAQNVHKTYPLDRKNAVPNLQQKSEVHNMPDNTSDSEGRLIEAFYAKTHNLKSNYKRLHDKESRHAYYKTHPSEAYAGVRALINAINALLDLASRYDRDYNTYNHFLIIGLLHTHEKRLSCIGIALNKDERVILKHAIFYRALIDSPETFEFLFNEPHNLIEELDKFYIRLVNKGTLQESEGQILDLKG